MIIDMNIKAIIFDWGRTLFDSEKKIIYSDSEEILRYCKEKGYKLAVGSLVTFRAHASLDERINQIENSPLRKYFEIVEVVENENSDGKDQILEKIVKELNLPRENILLVDDRVIRGIKYGNKNGHPTVWFQNSTFANELPNVETGNPTFTIKSLLELKKII